ncbi:MAG: 5'-3' exonuclease [Candidatus Endobugula sp.]|jgi:5'-3' exonuclease
MLESSVKKSSPVLLIDASIYIFQYYFALPDHWFSEDEQWPTAAVYGYTAFLIRLLKTQQPKRIAACFDESLDQCFRNEIYADYKCSRALPDEALAFQLKACKQVTKLLGISRYASARYEADDLLGCLYQRCKRSASPIAILTRDKDLGQLLQRPQDFLWDHAKDQRSYDDDIKNKFGVHPEQLIDYLALVGDSVDDIPGVPGIGKKTAQQLLQHFGSIQGLFKQLDDIEKLPIRGAKRMTENLRNYREQIGIAQQLATIVTDLPIISSIHEINKQPVDSQRLEKFCFRMGFPKLQKTIIGL